MFVLLNGVFDSSVNIVRIERGRSKRGRGSALVRGQTRGGPGVSEHLVTCIEVWGQRCYVGGVADESQGVCATAGDLVNRA